jgi:hypothetical protein
MASILVMDDLGLGAAEQTALLPIDIGLSLDRRIRRMR